MHGLVIADSKFLKLLMPIHLYLRREAANDDINGIIGGKAFVERFYYFQCFYGIVLCFYPLFGVHAVITAAAVFRAVDFAKIAHQRFTPAYTAFGIGHG